MSTTSQLQATTLSSLCHNLNPRREILDTDPFYVPLQPKGEAPVRKNMLASLLESHSANLSLFQKEHSSKHFSYAKLLFTGSRSSGKTTELLSLCNECKDVYETVYIHNPVNTEWSFSNDREFLYFITGQLVEHFQQIQLDDIRILTSLWSMLDTIQYKLLRSIHRKIENDMQFPVVIGLLKELSSKNGFSKKEKESIENNENKYFRDFLKDFHALLKTLDEVLMDNGKMLLLVMDGMDDLQRYSIVKNILHGANAITKLPCSMVVTYPAYMFHIFEQAAETKSFVLWQANVLKTDGMLAMHRIVEGRANINEVLSNPKDLDNAILNSNGNIQDLFTFLLDAANNALSNEHPKITTEDLETAYAEKTRRFQDLLDKDNLPLLMRILNNPTEYPVLDQLSKNAFLGLFINGMIVDNIKERRYDIHPLLKETLKKQQNDLPASADPHSHLIEQIKFYASQAEAYLDGFQFDKATEACNNALVIAENNNLMDTLETASVYVVLGKTLLELETYDAALKALLKAKPIIEKKRGKRHLETFDLYETIATAYGQAYKFRRSLKYFQKALKIREEILDDNNPDYSAIYNDMGLMYIEMQDYPAALEYFQKDLAIIKKACGPRHPNIAAIYHNFGLVYCHMKEYKKSLEYYRKSLEIREQELGQEHPETALAYCNIGIVYNKTEDYKTSVKYLSKAYFIQEKILGEDNFVTKNSKSWLSDSILGYRSIHGDFSGLDDAIVTKFHEWREQYKFNFYGIY